MPVQFFGQYLWERGLIDRRQLLEVMEEREASGQLFGQVALAKGFLDEEGVRRVLDLQLCKDIRFGDGAIELGLLNEGQVKEILAVQGDNLLRFVDAIVNKGFSERANIEAALQQFEESQSLYAALEMTLDESVPLARFAVDLFSLTHRMLLRSWGMQSTWSSPAYGVTTVDLPNLAAEVQFQGDLRARFLVGAEQDAVEWGALQFVDMMALNDDVCKDLVREFANVVAGNMVALLAKRGTKTETTPPIGVESSVRLGGQSAITIAFTTPYGEVRAVVAPPE